MSNTQDTSQWISFFMKAGLPPNVAANYALIFSENRIQLDMLMDLSKEYLFDMGIKLMGDVIAILRFAKEFHTQLAKERVIGNAAIPVGNKNAVAGRMVGHYTRPVITSPNKSFNVQSKDVSKPVISLKRQCDTEFAVKKIRKVPPEEEGAYNIKMPLGTTERTRKILQQQQFAQGVKRSVFSRLESAVSSSTDCKNTSSVFERLGPSNKNMDDVPSSTVKAETERTNKALQYQGVLKMNVASKKLVSTSFPKKGNMTSRTVIKPSLSGLDNITKTINLKRINTILESNKAPKKVICLKNGSKLTDSQGIFGKRVLPATQKLGIKSRLGQKIDARNLARTKILAKSKIQMPKRKVTNVFDRLGR